MTGATKKYKEQEELHHLAKRGSFCSEEVVKWVSVLRLTRASRPHVLSNQQKSIKTLACFQDDIVFQE